MAAKPRFAATPPQVQPRRPCRVPDAAEHHVRVGTSLGERVYLIGDELAQAGADGRYVFAVIVVGYHVPCQQAQRRRQHQRAAEQVTLQQRPPTHQYRIHRQHCGMAEEDRDPHRKVGPCPGAAPLPQQVQQQQREPELVVGEAEPVRRTQHTDQHVQQETRRLEPPLALRQPECQPAEPGQVKRQVRQPRATRREHQVQQPQQQLCRRIRYRPGFDGERHRRPAQDFAHQPALVDPLAEILQRRHHRDEIQRRRQHKRQYAGEREGMKRPHPNRARVKRGSGAAPRSNSSAASRPTTGPSV